MISVSKTAYTRFLYIIFYLLSNFSLASFLVEEKKDLFYATLPIQTDLGQGTGLIYDFHTTDGTFPYLITSKHIIHQQEKAIYATKGTLNFHTTDGKFIRYDIDNFYQYFDFNSPTKNLCCMPLKVMIDNINQKLIMQHKILYQNSFNQCAQIHLPSLQSSLIHPSSTVTVYYRALNLSHVVDFQAIDPIQDIFTVGYPKGLFDESNNLPIFCRGATASHLGKNFQGRPEFLVNMPCLPGSSGSPVFICPQQVLSRSLTNTASSRPQFLGILWSRPIHKILEEPVHQDDKIKYETIPSNVTTSTISPLNFGLVIKSTELINFK